MRGQLHTSVALSIAAAAALAMAAIVATTTIASAAPLSIAPSYPRRVGGRAPTQGINRSECTSPLERWRFAFTIPAVSFSELQVFARKTPGSCADPLARAAGGACHRVARFARTDVDAAAVEIPSVAMITAGELGVDADLGALDRDKACYPDGDRPKAPLTLSMMLFNGADAVGGVDEAIYTTTYDLAAPDPPPDFAATADGPTVHTTWSALASTASVKTIHAFCFDLDAAGDAGEPPCAIPPAFIVHDKFVAPGLDGFVCASAAPSARSLDLAGLVPGHHYVLTIAVVDDEDNTGALAAPSCARLAANAPVEGDAGPPPLPPVNACSCRTASLTSARSGSGSVGSAGIIVLSLSIARLLRRRGPPRTVA